MQHFRRFGARLASIRNTWNVKSRVKRGVMNSGNRMRLRFGGSLLMVSSMTALCVNNNTNDENNEDNHENVYTLEEVSRHNTSETRIWVTYGDDVYDITDFIEYHPGGAEKIMLAAGGQLEPFWRIYQQHLQDDEPIELVSEYLKKYKIGKLKAGEKRPPVDMSDPYADEPPRHPALVVRKSRPFNAEVPRTLMMENYITPSALWYVRHHHPVPNLDRSAYRLRVGGKHVKDGAVTLSLDDLRKKFPQHEVVVTLQCAGNRRSDYPTNAEGVSVQGLLWTTGAMSTGRFRGPRLRDVLAYAGVSVNDLHKLDAKHVQLIGTDAPYDASIPVEKAVSHSGDVILALDMNDEPIPRDHGAPVRAIVPGHVAARSVKWVNEVIVSDTESKSTWQSGMPYKGVGPNISSYEGIDPSNLLSVQELPVQSAIVEPAPNTTHDSIDSVTVRGIAWSGGGRGIARVDVSPDGGTTWQQAQLLQGSEQPVSRAWAWTFWETEVPVTPGYEGDMNLCVKAVDASYNVQPERVEPIWNLRGILNNSWHRVNIHVSNKDE